MNVDEAMAKWKALREQYDWPKLVPTLTDVFVAEVERLRAELAAAKAASVCPVELVALSDAVWQCSVGVKSGADADRLYNWLRDRMKENQ